MDHLAFDGDAGTDIVPSRDLLNGEHIAIVQANIGIELAGHSFRNGNRNPVAGHTAALGQFISGQICSVGVRSAFEAAGNANQICRAHVLAQRIFSRPRHLSLNDHGRGIKLAEVAVNEDSVFWSQHDVVLGVPA